MKKLHVWLVVGLGLVFCVNHSMAQEERGNRRGGGAGGVGGGPGGPGNPMELLRNSPLMRALDANGDGILSQEEIENAVTVLHALDRNRDGQLTMDELIRPNRRGGAADADRGGRRQGAGQGAAAMIERLKQFDTNDDGKIKREDVPERLQAMFDRIDANDDEIVDKKELETFANRMAGQAGNRGQGQQDRRRDGEGGRGDAGGQGGRGGTGRQGGRGGAGGGGQIPQRPGSVR